MLAFPTIDAVSGIQYARGQVPDSLRQAITLRDVAVRFVLSNAAHTRCGRQYLRMSIEYEDFDVHFAVPRHELEGRPKLREPGLPQRLGIRHRGRKVLYLAWTHRGVYALDKFKRGDWERRALAVLSGRDG